MNRDKRNPSQEADPPAERGGRSAGVALLWHAKPQDRSATWAGGAPTVNPTGGERHRERLAELAANSRSLTDIGSARRQLAEAVELATAVLDQAAAADVERSECLAHMSHELRTPLSAIIGFAEIIADSLKQPEPSADKALEYTKDIKNAGQHLLGLVNDLLDIAKVEAGKHELVEDPLDMGELLQSCIAMVRERAAAASITLDITVPESCAAITADGRKLKQVLVNLLSNAVKFTPDRGRVLAAVEPAGPDGAVVTIRDTGIGMSSEELERALEPFTQFRRDLRADQPGTGLGLPLAKALTELHGGSLTIESEVGGGTAVRITLPHARRAWTGDEAPVSTARPEVA